MHFVVYKLYLNKSIKKNQYSKTHSKRKSTYSCHPDEAMYCPEEKRCFSHRSPWNF